MSWVLTYVLEAGTTYQVSDEEGNLGDPQVAEQDMEVFYWMHGEGFVAVRDAAGRILYVEQAGLDGW